MLTLWILLFGALDFFAFLNNVGFCSGDQLSYLKSVGLLSRSAFKHLLGQSTATFSLGLIWTHHQEDRVLRPLLYALCITWSILAGSGAWTVPKLVILNDFFAYFFLVVLSPISGSFFTHMHRSIFNPKILRGPFCRSPGLCPLLCVTTFSLWPPKALISILSMQWDLQVLYGFHLLALWPRNFPK